MIDAIKFYKIGIGCFLIIAIASFANFFIFYDQYLNILAKISSLASIFFNFTLAGFFYYLLKTQTSNLPGDTREDVDEAIREFEK